MKFQLWTLTHAALTFVQEEGNTVVTQRIMCRARQSEKVNGLGV